MKAPAWAAHLTILGTERIQPGATLVLHQEAQSGSLSVLGAGVQAPMSETKATPMKACSWEEEEPLRGKLLLVRRGPGQSE